MRNIKATIYIRVESKLLTAVIDDKYYDYIDKMFIRSFYRFLQKNQSPVYDNIDSIFQIKMMT